MVYVIHLEEIRIVILQKMENRIVEFLGDPYILKDGHILEPLGGIEWPRVFNIPPYSLTIPNNKVNGIKLPKPIGKYFGII